MILWENGGIYMDAKFFLTEDATNWIDFDNDELIFCAENGSGLTSVCNGFIVMT